MVRMRGEPEANIFVASAADAATGAGSAAADGITGAELDGVYVEGIAALHYVLLGRDYESDGIDLTILADHRLVFVYTEMHGGWLFQFPDVIVRRLAAIKDSYYRNVAEQWLKVFERNWQPPTLERVERMLRQIICLAQTSVREQKPLYWRQESC